MNSPNFPETALSAIDPPLSENIQTWPKNEIATEVKKTRNSDDLNTYYVNYQNEPTPQNLYRIVEQLSPLINNTLAQMGEGENQILRNEAKLIAASAVKTFQPEQGFALPTWTANQLKQLRRKRREVNSVVKLPERVQLDAFHIERGMRELYELNGEEPDLEQLADHIKMPIKRITKVRSMMFKTPDSAAISSDSINQSATDNTEEAMHYIYADANKIDRKIMEHRLGYGGSRAMTNNEIAAMLGVGPDVISKRLGRILKRVEAAYNVLEK